MPVGVVCDEVAYGIGVEVVGPLSSSASACEDLFFEPIEVVVGGTSSGGIGANISIMGAG